MNICELCNALKEKFRLIQETSHSFSVVCIEPLRKGHLLILPKRHVTCLGDLSSEEAKDLLGLVTNLKDKLLNRYEEKPVLHMNYSKHASQGHIHFHLLPSKESIRGFISSIEGVPRRVRASKEELEKLRDELR